MCLCVCLKLHVYTHTFYEDKREEGKRERERGWMCDKFLMKDLKKHSKNERYKDHPRGRERERDTFTFFKIFQYTEPKKKKKGIINLYYEGVFLAGPPFFSISWLPRAELLILN